MPREDTMAAPPRPRYEARETPRRRSTHNPSVSRTQRSWTNNGVHYNVNTTSYAAPNFSFGTTAERPSAPYRSFTTPSRPSNQTRSSSFGGIVGGGGGLLGAAFDLLEDAVKMRQQQNEGLGERHRRGSERRSAYVEDSDEDVYDDLGYEDFEEDPEPSRSMFTRLKDRLLETKPRPRPRPHSREPSPIRRPRVEHRRSSTRSENRRFSEAPQHPTRGASFAGDQQPKPPHSDRRSNRPRDTNNALIEELESVISIEQSSVEYCKARLEQAENHSTATADYVWDLEKDLEKHKTALKDATHRLNAVRNRGDAEAEEEWSQRRRHRSSHSPRPSVRRGLSTEDCLDDLFRGFAAGPSFRRTQTNPIFRSFEEIRGFNSFSGWAPGTGFAVDPTEEIFDRINANFFGGDPFRRFSADPFPSSDRKRTRYTNGGPSFAQSPPFMFFSDSPRSTPPANLLQPDEALVLYKAYNERWASLSPTDLNIAYPSRGLDAAALSARDCIWAPSVTSSIATWSNETVMQANTQAFFLGAVGLAPRYSEAPGSRKIEMGFDKRRASAAQIKDLTDLLKKEKVRWHSDRLGRRNGGTPGPNETLQKDERARAVFHAVCGLMESTQ